MYRWVHRLWFCTACVCACVWVWLYFVCVWMNEWIASSGWPVYECSTYRIGFNVYSFYWSLIVLSRCEKCTGHLNLRLIFCKLFFFWSSLPPFMLQGDWITLRLDFWPQRFAISVKFLIYFGIEVTFFFWPPCVFPQPLSFCHTCSHSPPETPHLMSPNKFF